MKYLVITSNRAVYFADTLDQAIRMCRDSEGNPLDGYRVFQINRLDDMSIWIDKKVWPKGDPLGEK